MSSDAHQKVSARHLKRNAYLYVRQSTLRQVFENTESTERQYALRKRSVALGWPEDRIIVIDSDQGRSGASIEGRDGFQKLVADVGMGHAGIVMGLEVSRLARNSSDWHRLLEICALSDTLILDEDGVYDPAHFNDRLLLGLKGTMSEAELHVLRARLRGGIISKARRGELEVPLPIGFCYDGNDRAILEPDKQVQETLRTLFQTFRRTGSAVATVKDFRARGIKFPRRARSGPAKREIIWGDLDFSRALWILHNPRYAGAFFFGRTRQRRHGDRNSGRFHRLPREEWTVLMPGAHPGYITWDEFEENQRRLRENSQAHGGDRRRSPPREGPALLQGLVICGVCGERMTVRYNVRDGKLLPTYICQKMGIEQAKPPCQLIPGKHIDEAVGRLLIEAVTPMALEVTLTVQKELESRADETDRLRSRQVERARYESDVARRRFMKVDPDNRLVADELEAEWNRKLRALTEAQAEYEQRRQAEKAVLDEAQRARILALSTDLPKLWREATTPDRERKRMVRLIVEDVTLIKGTPVTAHVRFRGGATTTLTLPPTLNAWQMRLTSPDVVAEIDKLIDHHTDAQIAPILNDRGYTSGMGKAFQPLTVRRIRQEYKLRSRYDRFRAAGMLTLREIALRLGVASGTVKHWRDHGLLRAHAYSDKNECLYEDPGDRPPAKLQGRKLQERRRFPEVRANRLKEVQCEA
ncbi:MAG TPA: recombinase family protein [Candidatus Acidoferrum sp.]|nr:recombinase family protein [Candidatus Acidoferrum sp.]